MPRTIIIQWKFAEGIYFAHFPEPFPMEPAQWAAFSALFDQVGFQSQGTGDILTVASSANAPRRMADGLMALGYSLEHRGDVPPAVTGKT
ncbi:hypothetical protein [Rhizobium grahamii]|uniref:Uncharacterized protein n=2 Tax=Rhizobium grahamii TaxID=1120045 RepID=S3HEL5_9HYPH|nr:hypothetical protein [Rhizobium grahamii]EPE96530.1 hypothetical protein RGCCGE502_20330 [Rhizobium grahamii CCGE 502]RDJ03323.1 hypothetical protein B5K06_30490 [Rhizobium grahamii]